MQKESYESMQKVDVSNWQKAPLEYGRYQLAVRVPPNCEIISMQTIPVITDSAAA